jgi:HPt (histidine-containing phosphotransfer) domain-containing protein
MANSRLKTGSGDRPLLNVEILKQNLPSRDEALALLLRFKPTLLDEVNAIEQGLARNDLETVRFHTHRIRSGSLYLGIEGVGRLAAELEELIRNQAPRDEILAAWSPLRKACRRFLSQDRTGLESLISGF